MQFLDGRFVYSATDLNNYLECGQLVALTRSVAGGDRVRPERDPTTELIAEKGMEHERAYLARLRMTHPDLIEIRAFENTIAGNQAAATATIAAMQNGNSVIYQGTFFDGSFLGKSDFLLRVETPSAFGAWSYEVSDTKLALSDKPYFIIQLCHYSEHLERIQGVAPARMHVVLGDDREKSYRVADFSAYYRHLKASFLDAGGAADPYPLPCSHCSVCDWVESCKSRWRRDDHLSLVAWMRRDQTKALEAAGVATVAALATATERPQGMQAKTFDRLQLQAQLQMRARQDGGYHYTFVSQGPYEGFGGLPEPATGDVFFDMEGDPIYEIGNGLEYLFGFYCPDDERKFVAFWGKTREEEGLAFERAVDFLIERRKRFPTMHAYHYAPYEKVALRKLSQRHLTRELDVIELLRAEVLVDLYAVVRQGLAISQESYSIKKLEPFYGMTRSAMVRKGDDSILQFERWRADPSQTEILDQIEAYNEEDCRSTWMLRDWLLRLRAEYCNERDLELAYHTLRDPKTLCHVPPSKECPRCVTREREAAEEQRLSVEEKILLAREDSQSRLLAHLASYHRREESPGWWAFFDRCDSIGTLTEFDREAIGDLVLLADVEPYKHGKRDRNYVYTYGFPEQQHHLRDDVHDPETAKSAGELIGIDEDRNVLFLKRAGSLADAATLKALIPGGPIVAKPQKASLARIVSDYLGGTLVAEHPPLIDLLFGSFPRLVDRAPGSRLQPAIVSVEAVYDVVRKLDRSYLFVQGPPGTGKTYTGARVIAKLLADGKRVGVMANGHKAIHNMLHEIEAVVVKREVSGIAVGGLHKESKQNADSPFVSRHGIDSCVQSADDNAGCATGDFNLISGNGWLFARPEMVGRLDYLFIDEAGQTSLAEAIAVAPSARNIVLLGDPMQLAQVSQGHHGENAGRSVLQHLLGDAATIAENRGILLDVTYRMGPQITAFISHAMYDDRLGHVADTANNVVTSPGLHGSGLRYLAVDHVGNDRESIEEADRIVAESRLLLRGSFRRKDEPERPITQDDILIVTPYNGQRKLVLERLHAVGLTAIRVGTVDKFQGQEAPVVFYSMATSSGDDLPRNMEFLFEKNRFNVAISRAQCMSVLVCSPRLLDVRCNHVEQMALVNVTCSYVESAT